MSTPAPPPRRESPKRFLDASLIPVERALLARAEDLEKQALELHPSVAVVASAMANQFRELATELRYW